MTPEETELLQLDYLTRQAQDQARSIASLQAEVSELREGRG